MPLVDPSTNRPIERPPVSPRNSGAPSPRSNTGDTTQNSDVSRIAQAVQQASNRITPSGETYRRERGHQRTHSVYTIQL